MLRSCTQLLEDVLPGLLIHSAPPLSTILSFGDCTQRLSWLRTHGRCDIASLYSHGIVRKLQTMPHWVNSVGASTGKPIRFSGTGKPAVSETQKDMAGVSEEPSLPTLLKSSTRPDAHLQHCKTAQNPPWRRAPREQLSLKLEKYRQDLKLGKMVSRRGQLSL